MTLRERNNGRVVELVDTYVLGAYAARRESSSLSLVTEMVSTTQHVRKDRGTRKCKLGYRIVAIAADCKSALIEFGGSSPSTPTIK